MIGLKHSTVELYPHDPQWEENAKDTIEELKKILGDSALDIQHIGSTAINTIKAKPIIDIAVAVDSFESVLKLVPELESHGYYYRPGKTELGDQLLFACGSYYDGSGDMQTHFIHIVRSGSIDWTNYINFRDYLNKRLYTAKEYEWLKEKLVLRYSNEIDRRNYTSDKNIFIKDVLRKALSDSYLGKSVHIVIDRPIGSAHPKYPDLIYPINYGYIPGVLGGDGEELDAYLLGVDTPVSEYTAKVIAISHRNNDIEDKLIAAPEGCNYTAQQIHDAVKFQERYYDTYVETIKGDIVYENLRRTKSKRLNRPGDKRRGDKGTCK